jgi:hypothetical protein
MPSLRSRRSRSRGGVLPGARNVSLSGRRLRKVPRWLKSWNRQNHVTALDLSYNRLRRVPLWLGNFSYLDELDLSYNRFRRFPRSIRKLTNLTQLDLSGNKLRGLPLSLLSLSRLNVLDLDYHRLTVLQVGLLRTSQLNPQLTANLMPSGGSIWPGEALDRMWMRLRSLYTPSVSLAAVLNARTAKDSAAAVLQLYNWERDRLMTLAKGAAGAAITVLTGVIAASIEGKIKTNHTVLFSAVALIAALLFWGGFLLVGLRRLAEEYTMALDLAK